MRVLGKFSAVQGLIVIYEKSERERDKQNKTNISAENKVGRSSAKLTELLGVSHIYFWLQHSTLFFSAKGRNTACT